MRALLYGVCLLFTLTPAAKAQETHSHAGSKLVTVEFKNSDGQNVGTALLSSIPSTSIRWQSVILPTSPPRARTSIPVVLNTTTVRPPPATSQILRLSSPPTVLPMFPSSRQALL